MKAGLACLRVEDARLPFSFPQKPAPAAGFWLIGVFAVADHDRVRPLLRGKRRGLPRCSFPCGGSIPQQERHVRAAAARDRATP
jgi:hypothetical protein